MVLVAGPFASGNPHGRLALALRLCDFNDVQTDFGCWRSFVAAALRLRLDAAAPRRAGLQKLRRLH